MSGERGYFSYIKKKEFLTDLKKEELTLIDKINDLDHKNSLLSTNLDLDYIETLIRERFFIDSEPRGGDYNLTIKNVKTCKTLM